ncbi:MAG: N-6 DNA methylase, partial [Lentisphaerae bacterium]|nr:N-6 DNA methylase [Lentisphaerota bacterium]
LKQLGLTGRRPPEFLRSVADLNKTPLPLPQSHAVRQVWEILDLCGVVYVDGNPTAYLKEVKSISDDDARKWHRHLWNHCTAPILVVADSKTVHVYSGWVAPTSRERQEGQDGLVTTLERTADALELQQLIHSIETGCFYTEHAGFFDREKAVDRQLLHHLEAVRKELTSGRGPLTGCEADALLTRTIFACYLVAKEIISGEHFQDSKLASLERVGGLQRLLCAPVKPNDAADILFDLFEHLKNIFNGSMFDGNMQAERARIKPRHMSMIQSFLHGDDPASGQLALGFWAYDFSIIPIEMISAIYETFIEAEDPKERREAGAYYTPPHLVELVVDDAIEGWDSLLDKRVLDPASGSGIFLVSVFNRMAEQWRRENPGARNLTRAKKLSAILQDRLCGLDSNPTACRVATFSLYLALLDQLEPRDIYKLTEQGWKLPLLLQDAELRPGFEQGHTVIRGNLFDPDVPLAEGSFDLVVGNPPWVSRRNSTDPLFLAWRKQNSKTMPAPSKQIAHGFMWRTPDYLKPDGRGCLLLPTAVLVNETTSDFQHKWFRRFTVEKILQLADLSFVLFIGAIRPAVAVRFRNEKPVLDDAYIDYVSPKADPQSLRGGPVRVFEQDCWRVRQSEVVLRAMEDKAPLVWKPRLWGTPRDLRFLDRLMDMSPLGSHVSRPRAKKPKRWLSGGGFQKYNPRERDPDTGEPLKPGDAWWDDEKHLFLEARASFGLVLLPGDAGHVGNRYKKLRRDPDRCIFKPPMVILNGGFTKKAFSGSRILFIHSLHSITGPPKDDSLLRFLAAVLNSELATYFLFHTASSWGTERDRVLQHEFFRLPFPLPDQTATPDRARKIVELASGRLKRLEADASTQHLDREELIDRAKRDLRPLIWEYYDIDKSESKLIRDTVEVFETSSTPSGPTTHVKTLTSVSSDHRKTYADALCEVLNDYAHGSAYSVSPRVIHSRKAGLGVITLRKTKKTRSPKPYSEEEGSAELNQALERIQELLPQRAGGVEMARGMKVFDENEIHIIKPMMLRFWTQTAALNDADEIASAVLRKP